MSDEVEFLVVQLQQLRRTFYAKTPEKRFFQEKSLLLSAISFPAAHLKDRYHVSTPDALSAAILGTVTHSIVTKGNREKIERFSCYFLHCVQEHMAHHGEEYYERAKAARRAAEALPEIVAKVRVGEIERSTDVMVALHRTLKSKGGRKKRGFNDPAPDLFSLCKAGAAPVPAGFGKARKHSQTSR